MLVFADARLVYLAVPKTGSTAVETALRRDADIAFSKTQKHITARRYRKDIAPFLKKHLDLRAETCAVMRDPLDQICSWYRYRTRHVDHEKSTHGLNIDKFVLDALQPDPPPYADIGSQFRFLTNRRGALIVHHLFAYDAFDLFEDFLSARLGKTVQLKQVNVSPGMQLSPKPQTLAILKKARADDFALYSELKSAGGYLGVATGDG